MRPLCFCLATISVLFFGVFLKDAQLFAQKYPILFMEVSAFTGLNVDNLFSKIGTFTLNVLIDMRYWSNVRSRWLDIGQVLFVSVNKNTQKTRPIFGHLDRTSLVNKGFITWRKRELLLIADSPIKKEGHWMERDDKFYILTTTSLCCFSIKPNILLKYSVMSLTILSGVYVFYITLNFDINSKYYW